MIRPILIRTLPAWLALVVLLAMTSSVLGAATIVIQNADPAGVGFNDNTPASPVGGNNGTTLGQQRLNAFQFAANVWGATLTSTSTITVHATWEPLPCTDNTAALGAAGSAHIWRGFTGAPFSNTWYGSALANKLVGSDLSSADPEINARFNVNLGNSGCLTGVHWYYGLDNTHGNNIDLVTVLLHEFAHGLGFQTFTDESTGSETLGFPSVYDWFLLDNSTNKTWVQMTDAERVASAVNTGRLAWNGPQVTSDVQVVLSGPPMLRVNSPAAIAAIYQGGTASFGPALSAAGVTSTVLQAVTSDACSPLSNAGALSGKIALVDRGSCNFTVKVKNAQNAGAMGVVVVNNVAGSPPPGMSGSDPSITIPSAMITLADGNTIKSQLASGVNATLGLNSSVRSGTDQAGRALVYTPNPVEEGSSVSHWDTTAFPNQLMEPDSSDDLTHSVTPPQDLTFSLLRDIGWLSGAPATNPIDDPQFFVRQHYLDFLSREPDPSGLAFWTNEITSCGSDTGCVNARRIRVSNAFFFEQEYQQTGSYVFRLYRAAFGDNQPFPNPDSSNPTEAHKLLNYAAFVPDRARVVGGVNLAQSQLDLANLFVQRTEFNARYPLSLDGPSFVDAVLATINGADNVNLTSQRSALIDLFNTQGGRGAVMYRLADDNLQTNPINNRAFVDAEYNRAFVTTEYFGYLRRDGDINGLLFWFGQVNRFPLRDSGIQNAMVCSFLTSSEYQLRFGSVVTHTNSECTQ